MPSTFAADVRFALRTLRHSPLFAIVAVLCISLGAGAVTTIFSAMNALVLQPLSGVRDARRLVRIERKAPNETDGVSASYPLYDYLAGRTRSLDGLIAWEKGTFTLGRRGEPGTTVYGNFVSGNFFTLLGIRPAVGRFFAPSVGGGEEVQPVVVVSESFWRSVLGADSAVIGRDVVVNGHRFTLVGVAPAAFRGPDDPIKTDVWMPLSMRQLLQPEDGPLAGASGITLRLAGRLAPNATLDVAHRELSALGASFTAEGREPAWLKKYTDLRVSPLIGLPPDASGPLEGFLDVLLGAASLVLIIASVNVGAMLSSKDIARRREMAVRAALGATRLRLVRQLLTEILLLFALGAAGGLALAYVGTSALEWMPIPAEITFAPHLAPDARVFAFALAVSLLAGMIVGLVPARRATDMDVATQLRDGASAASARRTWLGHALVVGQVSASLVLLVGVGLFLRALQQASRVDPGFDPAGVATAQFDAGSWGYDEAKARTFFRALRDRVEALPGVTAVSYVTTLPLTLRGNVDEMQIESATKVPMHYLQADDQYMSVLRIPLVAGRDLARTDDDRAPKVALVNESFARRFAGVGSILGRTFRYRGELVTIVGVTRDAKLESIGEVTPPRVFFPLAQQWENHRWLMVRTTGDARALAPAILAAVREIDPTAPRPVVVPLERAMSIGLVPQRIAATVTGVLGVLGLILSTIGLYGVIAYSTSRRAREIGIRLALGARRADILAMIMRDGARVVALI